MLALLEIPHFTPYVGTAPGTTTIHISGQADLSTTHHIQKWWDPYADLTSLRGLDDTQTRWDLFAIALGIAFAGTVGYAWWRGRK